jgi:hypothetical protein
MATIDTTGIGPLLAKDLIGGGILTGSWPAAILSAAGINPGMTAYYCPPVTSTLSVTGQLWPQGQTPSTLHTHPYKAPARRTASITTSSLADAASATGTIELAPSYRILRVTTDKAARVRLYTSTTRRDADASRPMGTDPVGDHGLLMEQITSTDLDWDLSPVVDGYCETGLSASWAVTNLSGSTAPVTITLAWVPTEGV